MKAWRRAWLVARLLVVVTTMLAGCASTVAAEEAGKKKIRVGSNLPYAADHHLGRTVESVVITKDVQKKLLKWISGKGKAWAEYFVGFTKEKWTGKKRKARLPERRIVGVTKQTIADIKEVVGRKIFEV